MGMTDNERPVTIRLKNLNPGPYIAGFTQFRVLYGEPIGVHSLQYDGTISGPVPSFKDSALSVRTTAAEHLQKESRQREDVKTLRQQKYDEYSVFDDTVIYSGEYDAFYIFDRVEGDDIVFRFLREN